ncbi:MAG TPA: arginine--tRNA ligase [Candidatus Paceibacterota bacterium]|nr:arginine--tRNA ligase [Candidatus Paceibacterota bacterium]
MKEKVATFIAAALPKGATFEVTTPERPEFGHFSTNAAMRLAKAENKPPLEAARVLAEKIQKAAPAGLFSKVEAVAPGFVNFWLSDEAVRSELAELAKKGVVFTGAEANRGKTIIVEYSQPNIAKKMHIGHIRTTVLGDVLANLYDALGYKVVRWNYLGDWGTQFGKLIAAYKLWGDKKKVEAAPIATLLELYIRFHDELKNRPELEDMGRAEFKKLEEGDKENRVLWDWFKDESLKEFKAIYKLLDVKFDVWLGESFYEGQLKALVEELLKKGVAKESEGAVVIDLEKFGLPPALIRKADGASLYLTRDIANIRYRIKEYQPAKMVYVVGNEQALHFEQLFRVAELLNLAPGVELMHMKFGLVLAEGGKKFATREGRVILLEDVIEKAVRLAHDVVSEKNKELSEAEKKEVAETVAIGALKYTVLKENRNSDIRFDWEKMLDLAGDSGPYLQYTYARLRSILAKAKAQMPNAKEGEPKFLESEVELALVRKMEEIPDAVQVAAETYAVNHFTNYLYELAVTANKFYETTPILKDENTDRRNARLLLVSTVAQILKQGLGYLGIKTLEKI